MTIKEFPEWAIKENVEFAVNEIGKVIKKYGPRESGNQACYDAEKHLKKEMDQFCDEVHFEEYKCAPKAFLHFTKTFAVIIGLAIIAGFVLSYMEIISSMLAHVIVGVACFAALFVTFFEFLIYKEFLDGLHKKVTAHNLIATRKPRGEVKRRIIISGHIDAAYEWRHILYFGGKGFGPLMFGAIGFAMLSVIVCILNVIANFIDMGAFGDFLVKYSYYINVLTLLFMIPLFAFCNFKRISPGANDNLTGTYAAVCALRMLDMAGVDFENTEVVAMINDGEECGLRGAKAYARAHKEELTDPAVETAVLCVDTVTDYDYMFVYSNDMTGTVKHDKAFSQLVLDSAHEVGIDHAKFSKVYFGASDAAAFTKEGITATCFAAMDPTPADYYHNRRDIADLLQPKTIEAGFKTVIATILNFDAHGAKKTK